MIIIDSHCHLDILTKHDSIDNIVNRAAEAGVKYLQTICTRLDNFDNILQIANKYENVYASVGVHPSEIQYTKGQSVTEYTYLISLSEHKKVIGLGETGLDYFYNKEPGQHKLQTESFEQHILASQENNLPVIIHTRNAEEDTIDIIARNKKYKEFPALIHCFTSSRDFAKKALDLGLYISISGIITFKNAESLREIVKYIPVDRLLVETDSPYLTPVPNRGKTNEPAYTKFVLAELALLKNISPEDLAAITTENFFNLFTKTKKREL